MGKERGGGWAELAPSQKGLGKGMRKSRAGSMLEKRLGKGRGMKRRMISISSIPKRAGKGEEDKDDESWILLEKGLGKGTGMKMIRKDWGGRGR